jgi:hypothetical protein
MIGQQARALWRSLSVENCMIADSSCLHYVVTGRACSPAYLLPVSLTGLFSAGLYVEIEGRVGLSRIVRAPIRLRACTRYVWPASRFTGWRSTRYIPN